jgi:hypothetical protein
VGCVAFASEEHAAFIIRTEVRSIEKWMVCIGIGDGSGLGDWFSLGLKSPGVYKIPCECRVVYIGE